MNKPVSKNPFKSVEISLAFPNDYQEPTQEICLKILEHISDGKSLKKISSLEGMPTFGQLNSWVWRYPEFGQAVVLARSANAHHHIDRISEIMDDVEAGILETDKANTLIAGNRWLAQHLNPDIYGDRKNVKGQVEVNAQITVVTGVPEPKANNIIDHETQKPVD